MSKFCVGMSAEMPFYLGEHDVRRFMAVSRDDNPAHWDYEYCATTRFKKPIAHGMLVASYISAVLARHLPGPGAIYVSQALNFKAPVYPDSRVIASVEIVKIDGRFLTLKTQCHVNGDVVIDGEAVVMVPKE